MKKIWLALVCALSIATIAAAQDITIPQLPSTKEEFVKSEPDLIKVADWLEKTQVTDDGAKKRVLVNAYMVAWLVNSPTVTITMASSIMKSFDKNAQLLPVFMGGYARYCLQNNYSTDELKCNMAGMRAVINCYNLGGDLKKDKALLKVIDLDKDGKLEEWVKEAMKK